MPQNDGGPAFPCEWVGLNSIGESTTRQQYFGASVLDLFAAVALAGMLANPYRSYDFDGAAEDAWKHADAMLKAREAKP